MYVSRVRVSMVCIRVRLRVRVKFMVWVSGDILEGKCPGVMSDTSLSIRCMVKFNRVIKSDDSKACSLEVAYSSMVNIEQRARWLT